MKQLPADHRERERISTELDQSLLVEAAAGTGKTTSLVARMVRLLAAGKCAIENLAAITFTRKAAAEIRLRFHARLDEAAAEAQGEERERLEEARRRAHQVFVGTIHAFCGRLLRERPLEAGVPPDFTEIDDEEDFLLRRRAWKEYTDQLLYHDAPILTELADVGIHLMQNAYRAREPILEVLDELGLDVAELQKAFETLAEYPDIPRWPAPPVELPDLAAIRREIVAYLDEIEAVVEQLDEHVTDALAAHFQMLVRMRKALNLEKTADLFRMIEQFERKNSRMVQRSWPGGKEEAHQQHERWKAFGEQQVAGWLARWREHRYPIVLRAVQPAVAFYDRLRSESGKLNFQDLLLKAAALLRSRPEVRDFFRKRYTHLLVDEFQDTDPIQAEVMVLLTSEQVEQDAAWEVCRPAPGALFVVGDPKQSIYRFRRADIVTYSKFKQLLVNAGGNCVQLTTNFRSVPALVDWSNKVFERRFPAAATEESPRFEAMDPFRSATQGPTGVYRNVLTSKRGDPLMREDAGRVAEAIERLLGTPLDPESSNPRPIQPHDFLIVTRRKQSIPAYAAALQQRGIDIQATGYSALAESEPLLLFRSALAAVLRPFDPVPLLATLRSQLFGIDDPTLFSWKQQSRLSLFAAVPDSLQSGPDSLQSGPDSLQSGPDSLQSGRDALAAAVDLLRSFAERFDHLPPVAAAEQFAETLGIRLEACCRGGLGGDNGGGEIVKATELLRVAARESHSKNELLAFFDELLAGKHSEHVASREGDLRAGVRIMNLHKVKGLEAPIVFLVEPAGSRDYPVREHIDRREEPAAGYLDIQGLSPGRHQSAKSLAHPPDWETRAAREQQFLNAEEDRLLYVAATRAGQLLCVSQSADDGRSPWHPLAACLEAAPPLEQLLLDLPREPSDPSATSASRAPSAPDASLVSQAAPQPARDEAADWPAFQRRWSAIRQPGYHLVAAKEEALQGGYKPRGDRKDAAAWGNAVHGLLELLLTERRVPEPATVERVLRESGFDCGLDYGLAAEASALVKQVADSSFWQRVRSAERALAEVPFRRWTEASDAGRLPSLVRGVIDLAFEEPAGWVLVDYKTEQIAEDELASLARYYHPQLQSYARQWEAITGHTPRELGVYATHLQSYVSFE